MDFNSQHSAATPETGLPQLEFEDRDGRLARLEMLLERMNSKPDDVPQQSRPFDFDKTIPEPNNDLLDRVRNFLPQIQQSNVNLQSQDRSHLDIENVSSGGPYIEMDLGLGVFDVKPNDPQGFRPGFSFSQGYDAEMTYSDSSSGSRSSSNPSSNQDSSSSDDSDSDDDDVIITNTASPRLVKPLPRRRPKITVLGEQDNQRSGSVSSQGSSLSGNGSGS